MSKRKAKMLKKEEFPTAEKAIETSSEFGQIEAAKLAASYLPKGDIPRSHLVMWVTSDKTVFLSHNEGAARTYASKKNLNVFKIEN
jgi:hypothetical protein